MKEITNFEKMLFKKGYDEAFFLTKPAIQKPAYLKGFEKGIKARDEVSDKFALSYDLGWQAYYSGANKESYPKSIDGVDVDYDSWSDGYSDAQTRDENAKNSTRPCSLCGLEMHHAPKADLWVCENTEESHVMKVNGDRAIIEVSFGRVNTKIDFARPYWLSK